MLRREMWMSGLGLLEQDPDYSVGFLVAGMAENKLFFL